MLARLRSLDPRWYQIICLSTLLVWGLLGLGFEVPPPQAGVTLATALLVQFACTRLWRLPRFDPKSALITGLSLCLLLRVDALPWAAAGAAIAIASKFIVRFRGKHVLNPSGGALVILLLVHAPAWVSPGQWGNVAFLGFLMACLGGLVVMRSARADVALSFLAFFALGLVARSLWVGEPMTIPLHRLQSGGLLLFAFFMISDPKTTPDARAGRVLYAFIVAAGALFVQFGLFGTNGILWSLFLCAFLVPVIDRFFKGERYVWARARTARVSRGGVLASPVAIAVIALVALGAGDAKAFCGFYVAKADAKLFNKASQVVLVRDEEKTVLTMANDYQGKVKDFAMVVPVPTEITRAQIHIGDMKTIDHLDGYTVPRLVEYFDGDPCYRPPPPRPMMAPSAARRGAGAARSEALADRARALGVTIEATYTVGEYDILILSAKQSDGLVTWLKEEGYKIPDGAEPVVDSYLKQKMHWFVAKVNLAEHDKLGGGKLRPIQVAYESPKFMLPIRLGTVNAQGTQDLIIYALTKSGRVETTNYKTVKLPSDLNVPEYTKDVFGDFYKAMFGRQVQKNDMRSVITEYAWDMSFCDPCAAQPLSTQELKDLGVWWIGQGDGYHGYGGNNAFVTRLHVRYDRGHFPEDLVFQATSDRQNFQGRYILQHPFKGDLSCPAGKQYKRALYAREKKEAKTLADLTGWKLADIEKKMHLGRAPSDDNTWYQKLWK